ncbi:response regulator [Desulfovibrio aerotolerans]|uniref:Response regulator n=1 Tax=Solidesulfovibrio aerotolerans TaxID=295255 RepID=A0A7C9MTE2_9BACT|nr:response regulator [Solidesulfovibrio aerotolerans]MYL81754.1 response regulator [Solidesulfovibrio aerotolerans]
MPRALIVDDSRYQRHLILQALADLFETEEAEDGQQAIDLFTAARDAGRPFDLVVMDILMPVLDGHEALAGIRRLESQAGVAEDGRTLAIMLSSLDDPANMLRAQFDSGAQAYVTKPFQVQTLLETLATLGLTHNALGDSLDDELESNAPCKAF